LLPGISSKSAKLSSLKLGVGIEFSFRMLEILEDFEEITEARSSREAMILWFPIVAVDLDRPIYNNQKTGKWAQGNVIITIVHRLFWSVWILLKETPGGGPLYSTETSRHSAYCNASRRRRKKAPIEDVEKRANIVLAYTNLDAGKSPKKHADTKRRFPNREA
jgi:hypothetical protein